MSYGPLERIDDALEVARCWGASRDPAVKAWTIDRMVRFLCGESKYPGEDCYEHWREAYARDREREPSRFPPWDEGTPPGTAGDVIG